MGLVLALMVEVSELVVIVPSVGVVVPFEGVGRVWNSIALRVPRHEHGVEFGYLLRWEEGDVHGHILRRHMIEVVWKVPLTPHRLDKVSFIFSAKGLSTLLIQTLIK